MLKKGVDVSKKQKTIFVVSLLVNARLIVCLVIGYQKMSLVHRMIGLNPT